MIPAEGPPIWDGDFQLLGRDPESGKTVWVRFNDDGSTTMRSDYPVDDIIRVNKAEKSETAGQRFGDWRRIASVPLNVHFGQLAEAQSQRDDKYLDRWLDEHSAFRTFEAMKAR